MNKLPLIIIIFFLMKSLPWHFTFLGKYENAQKGTSYGNVYWVARGETDTLFFKINLRFAVISNNKAWANLTFFSNYNFYVPIKILQPVIVLSCEALLIRF